MGTVRLSSISASTQYVLATGENEDELHTTKKDHHGFRRPKQSKFSPVESEVLEYVEKLQNEGCVVAMS